MKTLWLLASVTWKTAFKSRATLALTVVLGLMLCLATYIGWKNFDTQNKQRITYQKKVREQWLAKPDKHPHRMAHYGYVAFRQKHELSFFDYGIESFAGVSIFLEAHKQNSVNFSEAGFSNGMLRFGEMSVALVFQLLLPLFTFFAGYGIIAAERETGTLKILLCQGLSWRTLLMGKTLGLMLVVCTLLIPFVITTVILWASLSGGQISGDSILCLFFLVCAYAVYFTVCSGITVLVSAYQQTAKSALITLLVAWVFFLVVMPRAMQAVGAKVYPAPSKIEFTEALESDLQIQGDSHNPDDEHYQKLKAGLLKKYGVDDVNKLPFNYGGYVMAEGEKISARIYNQHQEKLNEIYRHQNSFAVAASYINPFLAIKNLSMALTASDFKTYTDFQAQTEKYRYQLAQRMNKLQIDKISNKKPGEKEPPLSISRSNWASQPDFHYQFPKIGQILAGEKATLISLFFWLAVITTGLIYSSKRLKAV